MFDDATQAIIDGVKNIVSQMLNKADFDRTYTGRVKSKEQIRKGLSTYLYTITINGSDHAVKSKLVYNVGDYAMVLVPRNSWNDAKIVATGDDIISSLGNGEGISSLEQRLQELEDKQNADSETLSNLVDAVQIIVKL